MPRHRRPKDDKPRQRPKPRRRRDIVIAYVIDFVHDTILRRVRKPTI